MMTSLTLDCSALRWSGAVRVASIAVTLAAGWSTTAACGGATAGAGGTDTSTNWLKSCESTEECSLGSTCSCGRCTLECSVDADCGSYSPRAKCISTSDRCAEAQLCMPAPLEAELASAGGQPDGCTHPANDYMLDSPALCFGRELPECPPGSEAFVDGCGCGCSAAPDYPRACRDQCELAGDCEQRRFEEFPDYEATREAWSRGSGGGFEALAAGECSNGRRFIYTNNGTTSEARIFTPDGLFLGLGTGTDVISEGCWGKGYWPEPVRCEMATVTEVLNAGLGVSEVGQIVSLPWAEGPPEPFF